MYIIIRDDVPFVAETLEPQDYKLAKEGHIKILSILNDTKLNGVIQYTASEWLGIKSWDDNKLY